MFVEIGKHVRTALASMSTNVIVVSNGKPQFKSGRHGWDSHNTTHFMRRPNIPLLCTRAYSKSAYNDRASGQTARCSDFIARVCDLGMSGAACFSGRRTRQYRLLREVYCSRATAFVRRGPFRGPNFRTLWSLPRCLSLSRTLAKRLQSPPVSHRNDVSHLRSKLQGINCARQPATHCSDT